MSKRAVGIVTVLWVLSLLLVGTIVEAQWYQTGRIPPRVIAGTDFGFRIEGEQNGVPVGILVVQVDGEWVPAEIGTVSCQPNLLR